MQGIIVKGIGGFYYIKTSEGIVECKARGVFRKKGLTPLVGDACEISPDGSIEKILPRRNEFIRPPIANVDNMFIVFAAAEPSPVTEVTDKLTVAAERSCVTPYIIINKMDISEEETAELVEAYKKTGYKVFTVSAKNGDGIEEIKAELTGKTSVFAGCSGVGKTSIMNLILPEADLETGRVSEKISRGRHTTREVTLLTLAGGGYVADTPGFSSLEIDDIRATELEDYFPEFDEYKGHCRFRGCSHIGEPDCAVKEALKAGAIGKSRYESYVRFYERLKNIKEWER